MSKRILTVGFALMVGLGCSTARAEEPAIFAKAKAKAAELSRDEAECRALAEKAHYLGPTETAPAYPQQYGLTGVVVMEIAVAGEIVKARAQALRVCMRHRGYARIPLQADEARAFGALSP